MQEINQRQILTPSKEKILTPYGDSSFCWKGKGRKAELICQTKTWVKDNDLGNFKYHSRHVNQIFTNNRVLTN